MLIRLHSRESNLSGRFVYIWVTVLMKMADSDEANENGMSLVGETHSSSHPRFE